MDDLQTLQERSIWMEYQVLQAVSTGGLRLGRAVRAVLAEDGGASDGTVKNVTEYIRDGYSLEVSNGADLFEEAYASCKSCMQGRGALAHAVYARHGVAIACLRDSNGEVTARCLLRARNGAVYAAPRYGVDHYLLSAVLSALSVSTDVPHWSGLTDSDVSITSRAVVRIGTVVTSSNGPWIKCDDATAERLAACPAAYEVERSTAYGSAQYRAVGCQQYRIARYRIDTDEVAVYLDR